MTTQATPGPGGLELVGPAPFVAHVVRPMTKVFNPVVRKFAGRRRFMMAAQIHHVGRKSGRSYVTPATARRAGDLIVVPLSFGSKSDWVRNVLAAGGCEIRLGGHDYVGTDARLVTLADARPVLETAYTRSQLRLMTKLGIQQVLYLDAAPSTNASQPNRRIP
jgi:deazaflavin-dependent oxidoreductase (nitroreductase family)